MAFSRVGFPGSREASSHPCRRLQERQMPSTEGGAPPPPPARASRQPGLPTPAHPRLPPLRGLRAVLVSHCQPSARGSC